MPAARPATGRAIALCLGVYALASLGGSANLWWIDVRPLPQAALAPVALAWIAHAARPGWWGLAATAAAGCAVAWNVIAFYDARFTPAVPVPLSALVLLLLAAIARPPRVPLPWISVPVALAALFPLAHVFLYGTSDYARPADRIVVFGARCYADGRPSLTLEDRMKAACALYRRGLAPKMLLSGGPGDGAVHETDAMRRLALEAGVPDRAIEIDRDGLDTAATVRNTSSGTVLAVSHFYHLPRIQMAYRSVGRTAYTVPARASRPVRGTPYFVAREVAAFWWYWLRGAVAG